MGGRLGYSTICRGLLGAWLAHLSLSLALRSSSRQLVLLGIAEALAALLFIPRRTCRGGGALCGAPSTDEGEECDNGEANNGGGAICKADCTLNQCGDGYVAVVVEQLGVPGRLDRGGRRCAGASG